MNFAEFVWINHSELIDKYLFYDQHKVHFSGHWAIIGKKLRSLGQNCHRELVCFVCMQQGVISARVVMGTGIDNCESPFPVATPLEGVISKAAEEAVFEAMVERYDFI